MARITKSLLCPACGERMKVAPRQGDSKVCCPHCRQNVIPELQKPEVPDSLPDASGLLEEVLLLCKQKREQIVVVQRDLEVLEERAKAIGVWLRGLDEPTGGERSEIALIDLQYRLFDQLKTLEIGGLALVDCDSANEKSLARIMARTFEAFGWKIEISSGELERHCGEEITLFVAPGPVTYPVASVYFALVNSGLRLHSRIDVEQSQESPLLYVHRLSNIPKLLPSPKREPGVAHSDELRKSA